MNGLLVQQNQTRKKQQDRLAPFVFSSQKPCCSDAAHTRRNCCTNSSFNQAFVLSSTATNCTTTVQITKHALASHTIGGIHDHRDRDRGCSVPHDLLHGKCHIGIRGSFQEIFPRGRLQTTCTYTYIGRKRSTRTLSNTPGSP